MATESSPLLAGIVAQAVQANKRNKRESNETTCAVDDEKPQTLASPIGSVNCRSGRGQENVDAGENFLEALVDSDSTRDAALKKDGVGPAVFLIRDAVLGEDFENPADGAYDPYIDVKQERRNAVSVICRRVCSHQNFITFFHLTCWVMAALTFVEPPSWCRAGDAAHDQCGVLLSAQGSPIDSSSPGNASNTDISMHEVGYYPNSGAFMLTQLQSQWVEAFCLVLIATFLALRWGRDGMSLSIYFRSGPSRVNRVVQVLALSSLVAGLTTGYSFHHPYARLAFLVSLNQSGVQRELAALVQMLPDVLQILTLLGTFVLFYAWFGTVTFLGTNEGEMYFPNLIEGVWSLWIAVTTANFPDVAMPLYNENRWVILYFGSFMGASFFFLLPLILAIVTESYNELRLGHKKDDTKLAHDCFRKAYQLLDPKGTGELDKEAIMSLFHILNEDFPEFRYLDEAEMALVFAILDKDGTSSITEDEFMEFGKVMMIEFTRAEDFSSWVERYFPNYYLTERHQKFCSFVMSDRCELLVDFILVLNGLVVAIQTWPELDAHSDVQIDPAFFDGSIDTPWEVIETMFTAVYIFEIFVKVTVYGWRNYIHSIRNIFDFIVTMLAAISSAVVYYPNGFSDSRLVRLIVMARVMRLTRLFAANKTFQLLMQVQAQILPAAKSVLLVLVYLLYLFSTLGVHAFGGLISRDPSNPRSARILASDFGQSEYWANNFNDHFSAVAVLFDLLIVNNWTVTESGIEAAAQTKWVRLFFVAFHILGVVLVNNLVIAFVISSFLEQMPLVRNRAPVELTGDAIVHGNRAMFEASTVTGTKTQLSGRYVAELRSSGRDINGGLLKDMFTKDTEGSRRSIKRHAVS